MTRVLAIALLAALVGVACASEPEPVSEPVVQQPPPAPEPVAPPPRPEPAEVTVADTPPPRPMRLPKTASPLPLVGIAGVFALGLAGGARVLRRSLLRQD